MKGRPKARNNLSISGLHQSSSSMDVRMHGPQLPKDLSLESCQLHLASLRSHPCKSRTWYKVSCYYWPANFRMATRTFHKSILKQLASSAGMLLELRFARFDGRMEFDTWIYLWCTNASWQRLEKQICAGSQHEPWCGRPQSPGGNGGLSAPEMCHLCHLCHWPELIILVTSSWLQVFTNV